jgi:hypothetical protein
MGASWIHGVDGNPLTELADELNIMRVETDYDNGVTFYSDGSPMPDADADEYYSIFEEIIETAYVIAEERDHDLPLSEAIQLALVELEYEFDDEENQILAYFINTTIEHEYANRVGKLSAWYWNESEAYAGEDVVFPNGYDWLTDHLAQGLDIRLEMPVTQIDYAYEEGVRVWAGANFCCRCRIGHGAIGRVEGERHHLQSSVALRQTTSDSAVAKWAS